jgi:hypothetical protein
VRSRGIRGIAERRRFEYTSVVKVCFVFLEDHDVYIRMRSKDEIVSWIGLDEEMGE